MKKILYFGNNRFCRSYSLSPYKYKIMPKIEWVITVGGIALYVYVIRRYDTSLIVTLIVFNIFFVTPLIEFRFFFFSVRCDDDQSGSRRGMAVRSRGICGQLICTKNRFVEKQINIAFFSFGKFRKSVKNIKSNRKTYVNNERKSR